MGRLIDADALLNEFNPDSDALIDNILARMRIAKQPTAYSVDKIIDELDKASYRIDDSATLSSRDVIDIDDAIEIVRQGDVGKDVE